MFNIFYLCFVFGLVLASPPHIIVILADDYGWANIGYHNLSNPEIITPNLNQLNSIGIELDRHYTYRFCSPSRSALLSGRNPIHVNTYNAQGNYNPSNNITGYNGIPLNMTLISAKLQEAGYATHFTGKWDVGFATKFHLPVNRGFDSGFGYFQNQNDYWQYSEGCDFDLWNNTEPAVDSLNPWYCNQTNQTGCIYEDDLFVSHMLDQLDAHDPSQPLFYYWAMHSVHEPLQVPESYLDKFSFIPDISRRFYSAMVNFMDDMVGEVVAKLIDKKMWDNTLILFSSDNGAALYDGAGGNNYPLKGGKMSNWDGGIRVSAFLSGGAIPEKLQGTKSEEFITLWDWYATFCAIAGVDPTDNVAAEANLPPIDSFNQWPLLSGQNSTNPRTEIPLGIDDGGVNCDNATVQGIIVPPYKLLLGAVTYSTWQGPLFPNKSTNFNLGSFVDHCAQGCLFDLINDPTEHNDISSQNPDIVAKLKERVDYYRGTVFNPNRGVPATGVCEYGKQFYGGCYGPWVDPKF